MNPFPFGDVLVDRKGYMTDPWRRWFERVGTSYNPYYKIPSVIYEVSTRLTVSDLGRVVKFDNGTSNLICTLPSVSEFDVDCWVIIMRLGTGILYIQAADNDTIESSGAGGRVECNEPGRICQNLWLYLATPTKWAILAGTGTFQIW